MSCSPRWRVRGLLIVLVSLLVQAGCGDDGGDPVSPGGANEGTGELPPPDPEGVLLDGDAAGPAGAAIADLPPSPTPEAEIGDDGLFTTRLLAVIDPGASIAEVNATLDATGARIVSMRAGSPFVTLRIPAVATRDEALDVVDALRDGGGFLHASPAAGVAASAGEAGSGGRLVLPETASRILPPSGATPELRHLLAQGFPAAWNVARLAVESQETIPVLVPDQYASSAPHAEIDAQSISGYGGILSLPGETIYPGNQGFVVSGIIGANFDDTPITGTSPDPVELLDVESLPIGGLTWYDVFNLLSWRLAGSGDRFVLNTGLAYNDDDFATWTRTDRVLHAIAWRIAAATHTAKFVHVASSGSDTDPDLASPFIASSRVDDLRELIDLALEDPADSLAVETVWATVIASIPGSASAIPNLLVVAPGTDAGVTLAGAAAGDVRAIGVDVAGPCVSADPGSTPGFLCDGSTAVYSGGGVAAAQVSGLAAYMLALSDRSPAEVRSRIVDTFAASESGLIDAYAAVRALDDGPDGPVHLTLFDVAGTESTPGTNDAFDHHDLEVMLEGIGFGGLRTGGGGAPHDRFDLNGDGITHPTVEARFDVDGDGTIGTAMLNLDAGAVEIDETVARDVDVLCYHAYTDLYTGDTEMRASLLPLQHSEAFVEVTFPEVIEVGVETPIEIRVGINTGGSISYLEGVSVDLSASDSEVSVEDGETGPGGLFTSTITLEEDENETEIRIRARPREEIILAELVARRPNAIVFTGRESDTQAWVSASATPEAGDDLVIYYDHGVEEELEDVPGGYQYDLTDQDMHDGPAGYRSQARARQNSDVTVVDGDRFTGASLSLDVSGESEILGSPDDVGYQAWSSSSIDFEVEFDVWGEAASYSLSGTISTPLYEVRFYKTECNDNDAPCSSLSESGELPGGSDYRLSVRVYTYAAIQQACDEDDPFCATGGSVDYDGSLDLLLDVAHETEDGRVGVPVRRRFEGGHEVRAPEGAAGDAVAAIDRR